MKIGIVTYWNSNDNYGQVLQCWALQQYLIKRGHNPFLIRYSYTLPKPNIIYRLFVRFKIFVLWKFLYKRKFKAFEENRNYSRILTKKNKERGFSDWRMNNLSVSQCEYKHARELKKNYPDADLYITGSDQVWNNSLKDENADVFYLNFGLPSTKRISYAASMGRLLAAFEKNDFIKLLKNLNGISVRENDLLNICHEFGFSKAEKVVDPTLLLNISDYRIIETKKKELLSEYILLYIINVRNKDEIFYSQLEKFISVENLDVKIISSSGYVQARPIIPNVPLTFATIPEWLLFIRNAKYFITTSFHGLVFSILNHKDFAVVLLKNEFAKANDRLIDLLNSLDLQDRIISEENTLNEIFHRKINWSDVEKKLAIMREKSDLFLKKYLD